MESTIRQYIPFIEPEFLIEIQSEAIFRTLEKGQQILTGGSYVQAVPIVLSGRIKVFSTHEDRELLLYYIRPGESCIMSFSACIHQSQSKIAAVVEEETEALLIPSEKLQNWLRQYPSLNRFLFDMYDRRYLELLETVDQLIFWNLEARMMKYLNQKVNHLNDAHISTTHQEVADDLGSSREVVSRLLKKLEHEGKIRLERNVITLL